MFSRALLFRARIGIRRFTSASHLCFKSKLAGMAATRILPSRAERCNETFNKAEIQIGDVECLLFANADGPSNDLKSTKVASASNKLISEREKRNQQMNSITALNEALNGLLITFNRSLVNVSQAS